MGLFDSTTIQQLERGLSGAANEQKAISQNIANADTPGYKERRASFKQSLEQASAEQGLQAHKTNNKHINFSNGDKDSYINEKTQEMYHANGNGVDIDKEMSELAKNQLYFNAVTDRLSGKFGSLKTAVRGGS
ncbi:flagellar basal body rod protein FlgB [Sinobaca sp. H24]|uniref:flagellar basal body rod protein FlgB n=1 Tax=Sinobaca sp. H24 TaxID=2923376 RepID=UPI002079B9DB|nr:flagellar basal body rod protein FlgB [Sinobaca sp. H24]